MEHLAVETRALGKTFQGPFGGRGKAALVGVDVTIPRGRAFGLIGPNGAGKTTFVKLLLGVVRPTEGSVSVLGGSPEDPAVRARVGYLPERLYLPARWRAMDYLGSVARLKRIHRSDVEIRETLSRVGLGGIDQRIGTYSKGMRQRLGLATALLGSPDLLVLDEPTDGIDPIGRMEVRQILREELSRGATVLLNSHLLAETEQVCDRVGMIAAGKLRKEGPLDEICGAKDAWRLRFEPSGVDGLESLRALGFSRAEGEGTFRWSGGDLSRLNARLDEARKAGHLLVELRPELRTLEEVFADVVGKEPSS